MALIDLKTGELAVETQEAPLVLENDADDETRQKLVTEARSEDRAIAIPYPKFSDGRGFSMATVLRRHDGFVGELRAIGHAIPDQALHLLRAGFDTVAIPETADLTTWQNSLRRYRVGYQTALRNPLELRRDLVAARSPQHGTKVPEPAANRNSAEQPTLAP